MMSRNYVFGHLKKAMGVRAGNLLTSPPKLTGSQMRIHDNLSKETNNDSKCPVSSFNEWDLLEEIIVGVAKGSRVPKFNREIIVSKGGCS